MTTNGLDESRLPYRVDSFLATLSKIYERNDESLLQEIVVNSSVVVREAVDFAGWNDSIEGHGIILTLPEDLYLEVHEEEENLCGRITDDINRLTASIEDEYISWITFAPEPKVNGDWRRESGLVRRPFLGPDLKTESLSRVWGSVGLRVFLSHRATSKSECSDLKRELECYGVTCFVAHTDIKPDAEWLQEIERALHSMDVLVALLRPDFHDSQWTDQEIGIAIGRGIPVVAVRLGLDPYGFIGKKQALSPTDIEDKSYTAYEIWRVLLTKAECYDELVDGGIRQFARSNSYKEAKRKIEMVIASLDSMNPSQMQRVLDAFHENTQINGCFTAQEYLPRKLEEWSGNSYQFFPDKTSIGGRISRVNNPPIDGDMPF